MKLARALLVLLAAAADFNSPNQSAFAQSVRPKNGSATKLTFECPSGKHLRVDLHGDPLPEGAIARLGTVRMRHGHVVSGIVFSGDGKSIIASDFDSGVHVWDAAEGKELRHFFANDRCQRIAISPDGRILAVAVGDLSVRLCDPTTGQELGSLPVDRESLSEVVFSRDGSLVATRTGRNSVRVYDVATRTLNQSAVLAGNVGKIAFSSDGRLLACGHSSGVALWDLVGRRELRRLRNDPGGKDSLYAVFAPDGGTLAVWGYVDGSIRLFEPDGIKEIRRLNREGAATPNPWGSWASTAVTFSPDGKTLATARDIGRVEFWDVERGERLRTVVFHSAHRPSFLAFSPDGTKLATAGSDNWGGDNTIRIWDVPRGKEILPRTGHGSPISSIAVSLTGNTVATAGQDGIIHLWEGTSGKHLLRLEGAPGRRPQLMFASDGQRLIWWGTYRQDGTLRIWDATTSEPVRRLALRDADSWWQTVSGDGRTGVSVHHKEKKVRFHDLTTGKVTREAADDFHRPIALSPDGDRFVGLDGMLTTVAEGKQLFPARGVAMRGDNIRFSSDGRTIAAGVIPESKLKYNLSDPAAEEVAIVDQLEGKEIRRFGKNVDRYRVIEAIALSGDGRTVATVQASSVKLTEQIITLWETHTGRERGHFVGHRGQARALAISPDGRFVVSGGDDTAALVWDATRPLTQYIALSRESPGDIVATRLRDLAGDDAERAYAAMWALIDAPKETTTFLADHSSLFAATDSQRIQGWIEALDSNRFAERERASQELGLILDEAEPHLKKARETRRSAEALRRIDLLLVKRSLGLSGKELQKLRAIETLEHIARRDADANRLSAMGVLRRLAAAAPDRLPAREAKAALDRLAQVGMHR